ncbi:MAG: heavy metal-responsive transcriptional regulator [Myxococcota bacterium]
MAGITIGTLAKRAGVNVETVRYYQRNGLLPEPEATDGAFRHYDDDVLARLLFIRRAKDLGFTLKDIGELLALRVERGRKCADVKSKAAARIADIESKIQSLTRMKDALDCLIADCSSGGPIQECPILRALDRDEETQ